MPVEVLAQPTQTTEPRLTMLSNALREEFGVAVDVVIQHCSAEMPQLRDDESYQLQVHTGQVSVQAPTTWGALHGLRTAGQILTQKGQIDAVQVQDYPRYPWRGLLIDVARHFVSVGLLRDILDGMATLKLNVLHLHLTDDQGMRYCSEVVPKLASVDAYSLDELRELVRYAADRGVRVVPELDIPGHSSSWLVNYPELAPKSKRGVTHDNATRFGVHKACFDPTSDALYDLLDNLFTELASVFPDEYVHIGGDEVHPEWWQADEHIQSFMHAAGLQDITGLQNHFNQRVCQILAGVGKKAVGWDEVLHADMPGLVVQNWRGATTRDRALVQNMPCIVSCGFYLDLFYPSAYHYQYDPGLTQSELISTEDTWQADLRMSHVAQGVEWTKQWRREAVADDPPLTGVLGGEACLWSELVDEQTLETRLWSRLPAVAERLWSSSEVDDLPDFYRRLTALLESAQFSHTARQRQHLEQLGLVPEQIDVALLFEPVKWYARLLGEQALSARLQGVEMPQARPYDVDSELNRVVDYISPESLSARIFTQLEPTILVEHAQFWQRLRPGDWPSDVRPIVQAKKELGFALEAVLTGGSDSTSFRTRLVALYQPYGEYMLAVIPALLDRQWDDASKD